MTVDEIVKELDSDICLYGSPSPETIQSISIKLRLLEKVALYWRDDKAHLNNDVMDHLVRIALDQ